MANAPAAQSDDAQSLDAIVAAQAARIAELERETQQQSARILSLQEQLNLALARRFAARSEKLSPDQIRLFDEAEADALTADAELNASEDDAVTVPAHRRRKGGRRPLPEALPRVEVVHELPEDERACPHDGQPLKVIGEATSEQLDIVPATIQVIRHVRKQYACDCGQCIRTAALPPQPIPKSNASPGLLAHITVSKYQDALPLHRQETILQRIGVDIPRATLASWMIRMGILVQPLINLMRDYLLAYDILQMDETTVQVLREAGKTVQSRSYLWLQRGGPPDQPVVLFDYDPSRGQGVPLRLLEGFRGYLQTDGYDGYNAVVAAQQLIHLGCMAHARRKFHEAVKAQGKKGKGQPASAGKAQQGLALIQKLYRVEAEGRELTSEQRHALRQAKAVPLLEQLKAWLDKSLPQVPPNTATGKALQYLHTEWDKLIVYLEDGRLEIDNNGAENAIRPFVIGRKNWLFSDSVAGVNASANLYSLIETAKANGLEPYAYLRQVYTELPRSETVEAIEALLPWHCRPL
ncbi:MAG: IS66 family transposase [Pseudomonadales bacterium]